MANSATKAWIRDATVFAALSGLVLSFLLTQEYLDTRCGCPTFKRLPVDLSRIESPVEEQELRAEWQRRFGPLPSPACDPIMQWEVEPYEEVQERCGGLWVADGIKFAGCTRYVGDGCPVALIGDRYAEDAALRAHEAAHWYLRCTGHPRDIKHTNAAVWSVTGFVGHFRGGAWSGSFLDAGVR